MTERASARAPHVLTRGERTSQAVRANTLTGLQVVLSRVAEQPLVLEQRTLVMPQHSREAEAAMADELVACTLGQRQRPELLPDEWSVRGDGIEPPTSRV